MATVIDAFLVTLGLDPEAFSKGVEKVVNDMERTRHEADTTAEHMKEKGGEMKEFYSGLIEKATQLFAILAGGHELKEFIKEMMETEIASSRLAKLLNLTIEDVGVWRGAVELAGGSADGFNDSIKSMGGMLIDIEKKLPRAKRALTVFQAAGIKGLAMGKKTDVLEVLDQLAEKMHAMGGMEALRLGQRMGLDAGTIRLLRKGKEAIEELKAEAESYGVIHQEEADAALKYEETQKALALSAANIGRVIMRMVVPAMQWFADKMLVVSKWVNAHSEDVQAAFIAISVAIGVVGAVATYTAFSLLGVTWPLYLIAAALALITYGVVKLYQEWKKWTQGGKSDLAEFFQMATDIWHRISDTVGTELRTLWDMWKGMLNILLDELQLVFAILSGDPEKIKNALKKLFKDIAEQAVLYLKLLLYNVALFVGAMIGLWDHMWDSIKKKGEKYFDWADAKFKGLAKKMGIETPEWLSPSRAAGSLLSPAYGYSRFKQFRQSQEDSVMAMTINGGITVNTPSANPKDHAIAIFEHLTGLANDSER